MATTWPNQSTKINWLFLCKSIFLFTIYIIISDYILIIMDTIHLYIDQATLFFSTNFSYAGGKSICSFNFFLFFSILIFQSVSIRHEEIIYFATTRLQQKWYAFRCVCLPARTILNHGCSFNESCILYAFLSDRFFSVIRFFYLNSKSDLISLLPDRISDGMYDQAIRLLKIHFFYHIFFLNWMRFDQSICCMISCTIHPIINTRA